MEQNRVDRHLGSSKVAGLICQSIVFADSEVIVRLLPNFFFGYLICTCLTEVGLADLEL